MQKTLLHLSGVNAVWPTVHLYVSDIYLPWRNQNQLAGELLCQEIFLGFPDGVQWIGFRHYRSNFTPFDVRDEILEHDILLEGTAYKAQVLQVQGA